jgi:alanine racemase
MMNWKELASAPVAVHSNQVTPGSLFVALKGENTDGHNYLDQAANRGARFALVEEACPDTPGVELIRCADPLRGLQEIATLHRQELTTKIVAITGSYGKTVTKNLLQTLLSGEFRVGASPDSFNSQLGVALSLLQLSPEDEIGLIEVGISKPGEMARLAEMVQPDVTILTTLGDAHIDTLGSREAIAREKQILVDAAKEPPYREELPVTEMEGLDYKITFPDGSVAAGKFPSRFPHLPETLDCAVKAAWQLGARQIGEALATYTPQPIRTDVWRSPTGKLLVNDHSGTHPLSRAPAQRLFGPQLTAEMPAGPSKLVIQLEAVRQNVERLRAHGDQVTIMGMLKANAYATDAPTMARFLTHCGVNYFGVAHPHEGAQLREAGIEEPILVLHASPADAPLIARHNLEVGVADVPLIEALAKESAKVHLNIDTGMKRLGCQPSEVEKLALLVDRCPSLELVGAMTHFAAAGDPAEDPFTHQQMEVFEEATRHLDVKWRHTCATAPFARFPEYAGNLVRIGIGFFGSTPSLDADGVLPLVPAVSLTSRITAIHTCDPGDTVSYGRTYALEKGGRIGVIPFGYYDGARLGNVVLVRGKRVPIVGTVCMDFLMVELGDVGEVGDQVLFFGEDDEGHTLSLGEVATNSPTLLLSAVGPRVPRIWRYEAQARDYLLRISK